MSTNIKIEPMHQPACTKIIIKVECVFWKLLRRVVLHWKAKSVNNFSGVHYALRIQCLLDLPRHPNSSITNHFCQSTYMAFLCDSKKQTKKINKYTKLNFCITQTSENFTSVHIVKISFPILSLLTLFSSVPRSALIKVDFGRRSHSGTFYQPKAES